MNGQLIEKENSKNQLQSQLNDRNNRINQLEQQLNERNVAITQLQTLLSRCDSLVSPGQEETRRPINRIGELVQALTNEIQRGQHCLQIINQLNSEKAALEIYKNILVELNDKYPKVLPSFVYEIQQPDNAASLQEISNWARDQLNKISPNQIVSLEPFKNITPVQQILTQPQYVQPAIYSDPDFQNYMNLKRALGVRTKTIRNPATQEHNEYNTLYRRLYSRYGTVPDF